MTAEVFPLWSSSQLISNTLTLPSARGEREKLSDHGVNNILTLVSVTIDTCEWILMCEMQPSSQEKKTCTVSLEGIFCPSFFASEARQSSRLCSCTCTNTHHSFNKAMDQLSDFSNYPRWGNPFRSGTHAALSLAMCHDVYFSNDSRWIILSGRRQQKNSRQSTIEMGL